jgi:hypothetical protein
MPIPNAAHLTERWCGEVTRLITTSMISTSGPTTKNFMARHKAKGSAFILPLYCRFPGLLLLQTAKRCVTRRLSGRKTVTFMFMNTEKINAFVDGASRDELVYPSAYVRHKLRGNNPATKLDLEERMKEMEIGLIIKRGRALHGSRSPAASRTAAVPG